MELGLTAETFAKLLDCLNADRERAGEKYEDLRRTLIRFFEWRGAPFPEEHTDETFNRIARRLNEGVAITNIRAYCYEIARLIFMETLKGADSKRVPLEAISFETASPDASREALDKERRLDCLEDCLRGLTHESRELIVEYYQDEKRSRVNRRKVLAQRLGLRSDALANRAQRVRDKLERCVLNCLKKKPTI